MGSRFPTWIQSNVTWLSLSSVGISDKIPDRFWVPSIQPTTFLRLYNNQISGSLPDLSSNNILSLDIRSNNFAGPLPLFHSHSEELLLSKNLFSGSIHSICKVKYNELQILDLSENQFSGEIPNCWQNMPNLIFLNLADNRFSGHLPHSLGSLGYLGSLTFRNNNLTGELPSTLRNCKYLEVLDGGNNNLTGKVPKWVEGLNISLLSFRHNNLYGSIPPEICHLSGIRVLDMSRNKLSGKIPQCFDNFASLILQSTTVNIETYTNIYSPSVPYFYYPSDAIVQWKGKEAVYKEILGLLKLIDFSSNNLVGDIPRELSRLAGLRSLNLSRNYLTGNIAPDIGDMKMLETLDLSNNNLSGEIPVSLAELYSLNNLDLSSNSLWGRIPEGRQLQTFNVSVYAGNYKLCGFPLPNCPGNNPTSSARGHGNQGGIIDDHKDNGGFDTFQSLFQEYIISVVLGFIVGFWAIVFPILFKRSWRNAYYEYWSKVGDWLYVSVIMCKRRFMSIFRM